MNTSLLIVSYTFPPSSGIGGRRWAKFAKLLKQNGHSVKVITARQGNTSLGSEWTKDIAELKKDIILADSHYPYILGTRPVSVLQKLQYRLALIYVRTVARGNYYDKSAFWEKELVAACRHTIKTHQITNVICTIGPFRTSSFIIALKKEFPQLNFILDYRDPWTNNKTSFGFDQISTKRLNYEKKLECEVLRSYDKIFVVSRHMKPYLNEVTEGDLDEKVIEIPNGFDRDDFPALSAQQADKNTIKIVFAGTFYEKARHVFLRLLECLERLNDHPGRSKFKRLCFVFLGQIAQGMEHAFEKYPEHLQFIGKKSLQETYSEISTSDYCALFLSDDLGYSMSTKFYEYLGMQKPILLFAKETGTTAKFLEEHQLGLSLDFDNMYEKLLGLCTGSLYPAKPDSIFVQQFDIRNIVSRIEGALN